MISFLTGTLSASDAERWSVVCIAIAIIFGIVLIIGLIGEFPESEHWKTSRLYTAAKIAVILGVLGELLGDAGIFVTSERLQQLTDDSLKSSITVERAVVDQLQPRGQFTKSEFASLVSVLREHAKTLTGITIYLLPDPESYMFGMAVLLALTEAKVQYQWAVLKSNFVEIQGVSSTGITAITAPGSDTCAALFKIVEGGINKGLEHIMCMTPPSPPPELPIPSLFIMLKQPPFQVFLEYSLPGDAKLPSPAWERK